MLVTDIQRFCMHDGPGIRTTVFFKGCPLRCAWCHNPETQSSAPQLLFARKKCIYCRACEACPNQVHSFEEDHRLNLDKCTACGRCAGLCPTEALTVCGRSYSTDEIMEVVEKDRAFYGSDGGITLSGGEPFASPEEAVRLLKACKERGLHMAAETSGYFSSELIPDIVALTDLFLWDIKLTDPHDHKKYTGVSNERILKNLTEADKAGARTRLRCILVNGVNTNTLHYDMVADIARALQHCEGVEFIPYHAYAGSKAELIGREDNGRTDWIPSEDTVDCARRYMREKGIRVFG